VALHIQDVIGGSAVEPGAELALALKGAKLGDDLDQPFLRDLLGVVWLEHHADGNVVSPRLVPQDQLFQRVANTLCSFLDQGLTVRRRTWPRFWGCADRRFPQNHGRLAFQADLNDVRPKQQCKGPVDHDS